MLEQIPAAVEIPFEQTLEYAYPETTYAGEVVEMRDLGDGVRSAVGYAFELLEAGHEYFFGTHAGVSVVAMDYCSELAVDQEALGRWLRSSDRTLVQVSEGTYGDLFDPEGNLVEDLGALVIVIEKVEGITSKRSFNKHNPFKRKPGSTFFLDVSDRPEIKNMYAGYSRGDPGNMELVRLEKGMGYTGFQRELYAAYSRNSTKQASQTN